MDKIKTAVRRHKWTMVVSFAVLCYSIIQIYGSGYFSFALPVDIVLFLAVYILLIALFAVLPCVASLLLVVLRVVVAFLPNDLYTLQALGVLIAICFLAYILPVVWSSCVLLVLCSMLLLSEYWLHHDIQQIMSVIYLCIIFFCIGRAILRIRLDNNDLVKQVRSRNLMYRIYMSEALHDKVTNELSSIILMCGRSHDDSSGEMDAKSVAAVELCAQKALLNTHRVMNLLVDESDPHLPKTGMLNSDSISHFLVESDTYLHDMGYVGKSVFNSVRKHDVIYPDVTLDVLKELYVNIEKYCIVSSGAYDLKIVDEGECLTICSSNAISTKKSEVRSFGLGTGLKSMQSKLSMLGGSVQYSVEDGRWHVKVTIPLNSVGCSRQLPD
ncbi:hypothetical protein EMB92_03880 [Bifidobacterium callitrichos]|uniref:Uncharacterized protein n=2 Tax=Bifidobacterium callitrichos TaxID=762209 RepID=A0A5M9ZFF1_9BIFI|nr:hypothetical protein [Bifidobacterium callitrichos]KAA8817685.1 hypothetical protein EMB92_03880 [Bifidobacterium callitrichos]KFI56107.1 putative two-component system sensor kinase [Bifidobacterium callitrichos DSM 23973]